jgi:hypothetical protein
LALVRQRLRLRATCAAQIVAIIGRRRRIHVSMLPHAKHGGPRSPAIVVETCCHGERHPLRRPRGPRWVAQLQLARRPRKEPATTESGASPAAAAHLLPSPSSCCLVPQPAGPAVTLQLQQSLLCTRVRRGFARCFSAGCPAGPAEPARRAAARRPGRQDSEKVGGVVEPGVGPSVIVARPHPPRPISGLHPPIKPRPGLAPPTRHSWVSGIRSISLGCRTIFEALGV